MPQRMRRRASPDSADRDSRLVKRRPDAETATRRPPRSPPSYRARCRRPEEAGLSAGKTARHAFTAAGGNISAGKSFKPSAPAASAAKPSVGVATPGRHQAPAAFAARITLASECGITTRRPPASGRLPRGFGRHHGAGADQRPVAEALGEGSIERNGSGELSGTSMMRKPASTSAAPISSSLRGRDSAENRDERKLGNRRSRSIAIRRLPQAVPIRPAARAIAT